MKRILKKFTLAGGSKAIQNEVDDRRQVTVVPVVSPEAGEEAIPSIPLKAGLESLPPEIQSAVLLNIRDIASLKALIHASPRYHSAYLSQRNAILKRVLFNSIHPDVLYDAFFAVRSTSTLTSNLQDRTARVKGFLSEYKDKRDEWTPPEHLDLESLSKLARLQNQVQHATDDLCQKAFSCHAFAGKLVGHGEQLSPNEIRRFYRAFYRFEIFCRLFRDWDLPLAEQKSSDAPYRARGSTPELDSMEKSSRFLGLFNPWEVEELACVRDYFCSYYRHMLQKFEPDLRETHPNLDISEDGHWLEENIEYLMALSLRFYRRIQSSSRRRQIGYLELGLRNGSSFLSDALDVPSQADVYQTLAVDDEVEVHFEGDNVRSGPNVMWLWATGNKVDFSYYLWQNEPLREWGYVFWDQKRLEKWDVPNEEYKTWVERRRAALRKKIAERAV